MGIFNGGSFPTSGGTTIISQDGDQTLTLVGSILTISGTNSSVDLSGFLEDTNTTNTTLVLNGNTLELTDSDANTLSADLSGLTLATPTLQEVTDAGNTTTNPITVNQLNISDNYPILVFDDTDATVNFQLWAGNNVFQIRDNTTNGQRLSIDSVGNISLNSASGASSLLVKGSTGNIGIGTSSPVKKLHIINSTNEAQIRLAQSGSGSYDLGVYANDTFSIGRDADTQEFNIKNSYVGIGTSTPSAKLDVRGSIRATSAGSTSLTLQEDGEEEWKVLAASSGLFIKNNNANFNSFLVDLSWILIDF